MIGARSTAYPARAVPTGEPAAGTGPERPGAPERVALRGS
ncbi:hypothetical protein GA0115261_104661, partial [Streptomyces sp. OspMP-M43]